MAQDGIITDCDGTVIESGQEIVFIQNGRMAKGRCVLPRMEGVWGAILMQSLLDPTRTCVAAPSHCIVIKAAPPTLGVSDSRQGERP